ncbi:hypothetical protein D3C73_788220 [compost metagenome]
MCVYFLIPGKLGKIESRQKKCVHFQHHIASTLSFLPVISRLIQRRLISNFSQQDIAVFTIDFQLIEVYFIKPIRSFIGKTGHLNINHFRMIEALSVVLRSRIDQNIIYPDFDLLDLEILINSFLDLRIFKINVIQIDSPHLNFFQIVLYFLIQWFFRSPTHRIIITVYLINDMNRWSFDGDIIQKKFLIHQYPPNTKAFYFQPIDGNFEAVIWCFLDQLQLFIDGTI